MSDEYIIRYLIPRDWIGVPVNPYIAYCWKYLFIDRYGLYTTVDYICQIWQQLNDERGMCNVSDY